MKNNRILHLYSLYPYQKKKLGKKKNYKKILSNLRQNNYPWVFYLKKYFKNFKTFPVLYGDENICKLFLKSKGLKIQNFSHDIYFKQLIKIYDPKIIFFNTSFQLIKFLKLKKNYHNIKILVWDGSNSLNKKTQKKVDGIITNSNTFFRNYRNVNKNIFFLQHGIEKKKLWNSKKKYNLTFVGGISNKYHFNRVIFLYNIYQQYNINCWFGDIPSRKKIFLLTIYYFFFKGPFESFEYLIAITFLLKKNNGAIFGDKMLKVFSQSKIVINNHIDIVEDASNMRLFEVTGAGSCLLTDDKKNLNQLFKKNVDILVYKNFKDALEKIKFYLNPSNSSKLNKIAKNGLLKVRKKHSIHARMKRLEKFFLKF